MDGNSAKKAPVLDHLVDTASVPTNPSKPQISKAKPVLATMNGNGASAEPTQNATIQAENTPQNRRTDKSQFEIELTKTVHKIMLKHFEHASEEIVQQVLSEVRARLPGQRKS